MKVIFILIIGITLVYFFVSNDSPNSIGNNYGQFDKEHLNVIKVHMVMLMNFAIKDNHRKSIIIKVDK